MTAIKVLHYGLTSAYDRDFTPWSGRRERVMEFLAGDDCDFIMLNGVTSPFHDPDHDMASPLWDRLPACGLCIFRHKSHLDGADGLALFHRRDRWEFDARKQFFSWPPGSDSVAIWELFHELGPDGEKSGRAVHFLSAQFKCPADSPQLPGALAALAEMAAPRLRPGTPVIFPAHLACAGGAPALDPLLGRSGTSPLVFRDALAGLNLDPAPSEGDHLLLHGALRVLRAEVLDPRDRAGRPLSRFRPIRAELEFTGQTGDNP